MHDLQPLNAVTIQDLGMPPILDFYADNLGSRGSYMGLDLFMAFDHRSLAVKVMGPYNLPDAASAYYISLLFPWELQNSRPDPARGYFIHHTRRDARHCSSLHG